MTNNYVSVNLITQYISTLFLAKLIFYLKYVKNKTLNNGPTILATN